MALLHFSRGKSAAVGGSRPRHQNRTSAARPPADLAITCWTWTPPSGSSDDRLHRIGRPRAVSVGFPDGFEPLVGNAGDGFTHTHRSALRSHVTLEHQLVAGPPGRTDRPERPAAVEDHTDDIACQRIAA